MTKVKAKIKFRDSTNKEWKEKGNEFEVAEDRAEYLKSIGFVDIIEKPKTERQLAIEKALELGITGTSKMNVEQINEAIKAKEEELAKIEE